MQITHARTNDSMRRSRVRRASLLGWLPVAAAVALSGCTVKKTEAPGHHRSVGARAVARAAGRRPTSSTMDGVSQSTLTITVARLERQDPAERRRPRRDRPPAARSSTSSAACRRKNVTTGGDGRATVTYTAPNSASSQNSDSGDTGVTLVGDPGRLRLPQRAGRARCDDPAGAAGRRAAAGVRAGGALHLLADDARRGRRTSSSTPRARSPRACRIRRIRTTPTKCTPQAGAIIVLPVGLRQRPDGQRRARHDARFATRGTYVVRLMVTNDRGLSNSVDADRHGRGRRQSDGGLRAVADGAGRQPAGVLRRQRVAGRTWPDDHPLRLELRRRRLRQRRHRVAPLSRAPAAFTVTLTVTDSAGKTGTASQDASRSAARSSRRRRQFTVSPATIAVNQSVFFDGTVSTATAGRTITRYEWNFGDNVPVEGPRVERVVQPRRRLHRDADGHRQQRRHRHRDEDGHRRPLGRRTKFAPWARRHASRS